MSKQITKTLGGQERTMLFGLNGFFFHIKDATGEDPFEWVKKFGENSESMREGKGSSYGFLEDVCVIIYAGLNTFNDVNDLPYVPYAQVKRWASGLELEQCTEIFNTAFISFIKPDKPGEAEAPLNGAVVNQQAGMTSEPRLTE